MAVLDDLTGRRFGRLLVLRRVARPRHVKFGVFWLCVCDCGSEKLVSASNLRLPRRGTKSCGCLKSESGRKNSHLARAGLKAKRESPEYQEALAKSRAKEARRSKRTRFNSYLKREYGLTLEQYEKMLDGQNGKCAICLREPTKKIHVDHCHASGAVRGLLCNGCNAGIGCFEEDVERMKLAIKYVRKFSKLKTSPVWVADEKRDPRAAASWHGEERAAA